jgi:hypothetical protein
MTQPGSHDNTFPLPPPREIEPRLKQILSALERGIPTLGWLYMTYAHLPRTTTTNLATQAHETLDLRRSMSNEIVDAPSTTITLEGAPIGFQAMDTRVRPQRRGPQLVNVGHPANPDSRFSWRTARPTAQMEFSAFQTSMRGLPTRRGPTLVVSENGRAEIVDTGARMRTSRKRGRHLEADDEDVDCPFFAKKKKK